MSALHTLVSKADSSLTNVGSSASSDHPADARAAKYLLFAVLVVLVAALVACGASGEPTSGEQSGSGAPAPTEAPTDTSVAAQPTNPATSEPTETPTATEAPAPTIAPTSTPTQAAPTNTPAPTATSAPPPTPTQSVEELIAAITTPGPRVNTEGVWWWRAPKHERGELIRDYTPQGVYEAHPHSEALDLMDGRFQYHELPGVKRHARFDKALEYYVGVARREMDQSFLYALAEAEGDESVVRRIPGKEITADFMETAAWEVVSGEKPVVRYWAVIGYAKGNPGGLKNDYRVGLTVSFDVVDHKPRGLGKYEEYPTDQFLDNPVVSDFLIEAIEE